MARRAKKAPKLKASPSTEVAITTPRTISDLPPELLHMVFAHLRKSRCIKSIKSCMWVRPLRDVAVRYLEFKSPHVHDSLNHFLSLMRTHSKSSLPETVQTLTLSNMSLDASLVRELLQLLPKLDSLYLHDISCKPPSPYPRPHSLPVPDAETIHSPRKLQINCRLAHGWSLSGMMHILSLIAPMEVYIFIHDGLRFRDKFDPTCLAAFPAVRVLRVSVWDREIPNSKKSIANVLVALSRTLAPDVLQTVWVDYDFKATLRALGTLLKRIGGNVKELKLCGYAPAKAWRKKRGWVEAFDDWKLLDLQACKKLESISFPTLYVRPCEDFKAQRALSYVAAGLLANYVSPTLRRFSIDLCYFMDPFAYEDRVEFDLQEFDKVLTQARFPNLSTFYFNVYVKWHLLEEGDYFTLAHARNAVYRALPDLYSRDVLRVVIEEPW
ncbi:hypothetical protein OH76DRAFT_1484888 [Lentinus brumalis]|uniref:F-box domain-containing protein n=1 Tax=Lentinus brumalis TaxID=2498619 RepID=A0A371D413_9APHY|nr:hypothetical protein OH76DRAFT_1484888 [Polyporus brumalis]